MTKEELVQNADKQSYEYNTKYSEDYTLKDMLKRPQDFVEGTIENTVDLLKKKAYRDGLIDGAEPREKRIAELERKLKVETKLNNRLGLAYIEYEQLTKEQDEHLAKLEKENAELRKVAEFQQSSNMSRHFENKKLKEGLAVGSMWNKHLNSQNKALEEDRDKYRNMVFNKDEQLTNAKEIIKKLVNGIRVISDPKVELTDVDSFVAEAENFLKESEVEK